jgi:hypothetical protein
MLKSKAGAVTKHKYDHEAIKEKLKQGYSLKEITKMFGCAIAVVVGCRAELIGEQNKGDKTHGPRKLPS